MATPAEKAVDTESEIYPYQLVKFDSETKKGKLAIDCVPSAWVRFNISNGKCECKFLPPPYTKDNLQLLNDFVKRQALPPESWPLYPISLRGHAKNYDDAMTRLEKLRTEEYVYTTDDNVSKATKAAHVTKSYRQKVIKSNAKLTKKLVTVSRIESSEDEQTTNASDESNDSNEPDVESTDENSNVKQKSDRSAQKYKNTPGESTFPVADDYVRDIVQKSVGTSKKKPSSPILSVEPQNNPGSCGLGAKKKSSVAIKNIRGIHSITDASSSNSIDTNYSEAADKQPNEALSSTIASLRYDIQEMIKEFRELRGIVEKSALAQDAFGANVQSFASEYDVSLPMTTIEMFQAFDNKLQKDKKFCKEFTSTLHYLIDPRSTLSKNITAVLKKHLTRELASRFTAVTASGTKSIFEDTAFCKCFLEVARVKCKIIEKDSTIPITEKVYYQELGNALSNSVDWDGNRKLRTQRKATSKVPEECNKQKHKENEEGNEKEDDGRDKVTVNEGMDED